MCGLELNWINLFFRSIPTTKILLSTPCFWFSLFAYFNIIKPDFEFFSVPSVYEEKFKCHSYGGVGWKVGVFFRGGCFLTEYIVTTE